MRKKHLEKKTAVALNLARQVIGRGGRVVWVNLLDPGEEAATELRQQLGVPAAGDSQVLVIDHLDFVPTVRGWVSDGDADGLMVILDDESEITTVHCPVEY